MRFAEHGMRSLRVVLRLHADHLIQGGALALALIGSAALVEFASQLS